MRRTAFVSCQLPGYKTVGDFGPFTKYLTALLKKAGDEVCVITGGPEDEQAAVDRWVQEWRSLDVEVIELRGSAGPRNLWPHNRAIRLSEQATTLLRAFDIAYFSDFANMAFHTVRVKRFTADPMPVCVTVLQAPSRWRRLQDRTDSRVPEDLNIEFVERYSAWHSDFVAASTEYIVEWVKRAGWRFRHEPCLMGLPYFPAESANEGALPGESKRILFSGSAQFPESFDLFLSALIQLARESPDALRHVQEIVFLTEQKRNDPARLAQKRLRSAGLTMGPLRNLDRTEAHRYVEQNSRDTLAIFPGPFENSIYWLIEAASAPGLDFVCSRDSRVSKFLHHSQEQLFDPIPESLAKSLRNSLVSAASPRHEPAYRFSDANDAWLAFHDIASRRAPITRHYISAGESSGHAVDICIPYFNKPSHFPFLLQALEHQTCQNFHVIAVDDGSSDPEARNVFQAVAEKYRARGWTFLTQPNRWVDAARNYAAKHAVSNYLLMMDADDIPARNAVERLVEAAKISEDDCLVCASCLFAGDGLPYDPETGEITLPVFAYYMPIGASLVAGLLEPEVFGGPMIMIRRKVFEAIGGYRELRGVAHEDWELHARLALAGFKTDVLPEYLHFHRQLEHGLSRTSDKLSAARRIVECYDQHFASLKLYGAADAIRSLYRISLQDRSKTAQRSSSSAASGSAERFGFHRFAKDNDGILVIRLLRRLYRRAVPLDVRLRIHEALMKIAGRDPNT